MSLTQTNRERHENQTDNIQETDIHTGMRQGTTGHERGLTKSGEGLRIRTMDN